ncbi:MAG: class IV adenylate cyclase [Gemmatimonadales bacterium]|nr:class IV adenylate cyclase [Gemmatimonadales bacterium]
MHQVHQEREPMHQVHQELELKAVVPDPDAVRARLLAAGAMRGFIGRMTDLRYDRAGELASRDEVLRVRTLDHPDGTEAILTWKGPTMLSPDGYKLREEIELPISRPSSDPGRLLVALGYQAVHAIEREVEVYRLAGAAVRLETYPRMDVLLEVEGAPAAIERAIAASGIPRHQFTAESLAGFVRRYEMRTGRPAVLATSHLPAAGIGNR